MFQCQSSWHIEVTNSPLLEKAVYNSRSQESKMQAFHLNYPTMSRPFACQLVQHKPHVTPMGWTSSFGGSNGVDLWECFDAFYNPYFFAQKYSGLSQTWQTHIDNGFKILFMLWMCKTPCLLNPQIPTYHSKNWIALPMVEASLAMEQEQERESWIPP
jgi:hypothetical protein